MIGLVLITLVSPFLIHSVTCAQTNTKTTASYYYDLCAPFKCGNVTFSFPFSSSESFGSGRYDCGLPRFEVACDGISSVPTVQLSGRSYEVKQAYLSDNLINIVDNLLINDIKFGSCDSVGNLTISGGNEGGGLSLPVGGVNLTIFECANGVSISNTFRKSVVGNYNCSGTKSSVYILDGTQTRSHTMGPSPKECKYVSIPVSAASLPRLNGSGNIDGGRTILADVLRDGFALQWGNFTDCVNCESTGGRCGYDSTTRAIICFCKGSCKHTRDIKQMEGHCRCYSRKHFCCTCSNVTARVQVQKENLADHQVIITSKK